MVKNGLAGRDDVHITEGSSHHWVQVFKAVVIGECTDPSSDATVEVSLTLGSL